MATISARRTSYSVGSEPPSPTSRRVPGKCGTNGEIWGMEPVLMHDRGMALEFAAPASRVLRLGSQIDDFDLRGVQGFA